MVGWLSLNQDLLGLGLFGLIRVSVEVGDKHVRSLLQTSSNHMGVDNHISPIPEETPKGFQNGHQSPPKDRPTHF